MRLLSLGAGVQSTTLALMAREGRLEPLDGAIFADTWNEPPAVYAQLARLTKVLADVGVPVYRVSAGDIIAGALGLPDDKAHTLSRPAGWFASMPLYVLGADGSHGMLPRQCTADYKLAAVKHHARFLLTGTQGARVKRGTFAETWVGFSADEIGRVRPSDVQYQRLRFPLIELGLDRKACQRWLDGHGWTEVARSACIVCPLHGNRTWRQMRDQRPDEWAMAVAFDHQLREHSVYTHGPASLNGQVFLHRSRVPLDEAPIDRTTRGERAGWQLSLLDELDDPDGCSPYACRSGAAA